MDSLEKRGFRRTLRAQGRTLKKLSAGTDSGCVFRATINRIGAYNLGGDFSSDLRGKRVMEIMAETAPYLDKNHVVEDQKNREKFVLTEIGLDSPDYSKKFEMSQLTPKDQR